MGTASRGWTLLADGRFAQALTEFANEAESHPRQGGPKVGYALSAAGNGNLGRGIWAMRRAARIDPEGMDYLVLDAGVSARVRQLVTIYETRRDRPADDAETAFMVASLRYLVGDIARARDSVNRAIDGGDGAASTRNLEQLIDQRSTTARKGSAAVPEIAPGTRRSSGRDY